MAALPVSHISDKLEEPVQFLVFSASLREGSLNSQLASLAARVIQQHGGEADLATMSEFDAPSFDQDAQDEEGFPNGAQEFHRRLKNNDAFVIAAPEYNASMPGVLKNAIDWVSRYHPQPFNEKHGLLLSASPSMGVRTGGCGRCAYPWNILGRAYSRICSRWHKRTRRSIRLGRLPMSSSSSGSNRPSRRSWIGPKRPRNILAPRKRGSSTWEKESNR
jgi:NAD(P)H-dependent FMN reductase